MALMERAPGKLSWMEEMGNRRVFGDQNRINYKQGLKWFEAAGLDHQQSARGDGEQEGAQLKRS